MISEKDIKRCANAIVDCVNLKKGECVYLVSGAHLFDLVEEVEMLIMEKGCHCVSVVKRDERYKKIMERIPADKLENPDKNLLALAEESDVYIHIDRYEDPSIKNCAVEEKILSLDKKMSHLRDVIYGQNKKWLYAGFPTKKQAEYYGIEWEKYKTFLIEGMCCDKKKMIEDEKWLEYMFMFCNKVHVWDEYGTDFVVYVENRPILLDTGIISDDMIKNGWVGSNLPAGEVFVAPHETKGSGQIFCPLTKDRSSGKIIRNTTLVFEDGVLNFDKCKSDNLEQIKKTFDNVAKIDAEKYDTIRTYNIAELGIGCNPEIKEHIGFILTDEKIGGSVHLAFGGNEHFKGKSESSSKRFGISI
ncbi:MAG: aminopeptidase [Desulfobacterales bacterium]